MLRRLLFVAVACVALSWPLGKSLAEDAPKPAEDLVKVEVFAQLASLTETQDGPPRATIRAGGGELIVDCTHSTSAEQALVKLAAMKRWTPNFVSPKVTIKGRMERRPVVSVDEKGDMKAWLTKLRTLDPMRGGRWDDTERQYGLA